MDCNRPLIKILSESGCLINDVDPTVYTSDVAMPIKRLASLGYFEETDAARAVAKKLNLEYVNLLDECILKKCTFDRFISSVSSELCVAHRAVPLYYDHDVVIVAFSNPLDIDAINQFRFTLNTGIRAVIAEEDKILGLVGRFYPKPTCSLSSLEFEPDETVLEVLPLSSLEECNLDHEQDDSAPIIKYLNRVLIEGMILRASDIHFDPTPNGVDIRYRIDGVMQHVFDMPKRVQRPVVSRIKLLSGMDIAEKRAPQDGRFRIQFQNKPVDLRVSCVPTAYGEKIVVRILNSNFSELSFSRLGLPLHIQNEIEAALKLSGRMLLVTGPTGSGKTTTLYTALQYLNDGTRNIETVEDPIEYKIAGLNQIQINESAHVTFASCLRSILRQDPDVIMIGEIRDCETATIALQASQTGHFVLSTLHTNDAPSAVMRLLDLGCEPFMITSSVAGVLAQRLVRKVCTRCTTNAQEHYLKEHNDLINTHGINQKLLKQGAGCESCRFTGYHGRIGLYSYFKLTPAVCELIHKHASLHEICDVAQNEGYLDLKKAALDLVEHGITTLSEIESILCTSTDHTGDTRKRKSPISASEIPYKNNQRSKKTTIMLIEDDREQRVLMAQHLRHEGFRVVEVPDGISALDTIREVSPQLILSGLGLPVIDGRQLLNRIKNDPETSKIPVVILTSADSDDNEAELLELGADDFISRARSPAVVTNRIKKIVHQLEN